MSDTLEIFGTEFQNVTGIKAYDDNSQLLTYIRPAGTKSITANGTGIDVTEYASVDVSIAGQDNTFVITVSWNITTQMWEPDCTYAEIQAAYQAGKTIVVDAYGNSVNTTADGEWDDSNSQLTYQVYDYNSHLNVLSKYIYTFNSTGISESSNTAYMPPNLAYLTKTYTPTESEQTDSITIPSGKTGIGEVDITIEPISNSYIGSGVTQRSSSDLTTSGATVTAPAGYYANAATKTISSGTEGTPIASKGTVTNHTLSVTPSVTNAAGYISGSTKTGTAVTVSASELVSGSETKTENGTYDVTNLASLVVDVSSSGASNIVQGTFTTNSTRASTQTVSIPYTGNGYPIAAMVFIAGGVYNNATGGNTDWYNAISRYDVGLWYMTKARQTTAPTYTTGTADNYGCTAYIYKSSTTSATTYARSSAMNTNTYTSSSTNAGSANNCVRFKGNGKTLTVYIGNNTSSTYGFPPSTLLQYIIIYSS